MGGGVGVSVHGSHRVAGDKFQFAMPEVGIGFFPDVGATWFLPRMPGELGTYCALTGERFNAADASRAGIATHRVSSARFPDLLEALAAPSPVDAVLAAFAEPAGEGPVTARKADDRPAVRARARRGHLAALDAEAAAGAATGRATTAATIRTKSPTSLKIALAQVRRGAHWRFRRVHARRIPHRVAHRARARFLRRRARRDRRQGQCAALAAGHARGGERRPRSSGISRRLRRRT